MIPKSWIVFAALVLIGSAAVPWIAVRSRQGAPRCDMDGVVLAAFPSEHCAARRERAQLLFARVRENWLAASRARPTAILVADELSGAFVDAAQAHYVRSGATMPTSSGERRHVFARRQDALSHAESFRGRLLVGKDAPFVRYRTDTAAHR